jgi:hypothetical protein
MLPQIRFLRPVVRSLLDQLAIDLEGCFGKCIFEHVKIDWVHTIRLEFFLGFSSLFLDELVASATMACIAHAGFFFHLLELPLFDSLPYLS